MRATVSTTTGVTFCSNCFSISINNTRDTTRTDKGQIVFVSFLRFYIWIKLLGTLCLARKQKVADFGMITRLWGYFFKNQIISFNVLKTISCHAFGTNKRVFVSYALPTQPSECGQQRTLNIVHAQTAAQQQSNGSYEARMSGKCWEWRD